MTETSQTIRIEPDSELARALKEANKAPVLLESNGVRYRVMRVHDDIWAGYDPERLLASVRAAAGTLTPEEGEELKELIYRGREEGTRPPDRP
jgi:hypothetical protein